MHIYYIKPDGLFLAVRGGLGGYGMIGGWCALPNLITFVTKSNDKTTDLITFLPAQARSLYRKNGSRAFIPILKKLCPEK